jgi:hypothetical protein
MSSKRGRLAFAVCLAVVLAACAGSLVSRIEKEIAANPDLASQGLVVKIVSEEQGYVTLSVSGVHWGSGPGWDAKNGIRNGELFGPQTMYWGSPHARVLAGFERVLGNLEGIKQLKWQIPETD